MLNVGKIEEGFVLDHIAAGKSLSIYHHLQLDKLDCTVAIIKNARSNKMGKKDILKINSDGKIDLNNLKELLNKNTVLLAITAVDSELGVIQPIEEIKEILKHQVKKQADNGGASDDADDGDFSLPEIE